MTGKLLGSEATSLQQREAGGKAALRISHTGMSVLHWVLHSLQLPETDMTVSFSSSNYNSAEHAFLLQVHLHAGHSLAVAEDCAMQPLLQPVCQSLNGVLRDSHCIVMTCVFVCDFNFQVHWHPLTFPSL